MTRSQPVVLSDDLFIAEGAGRRVYRHPSHDGQIIKIQKASRKKRFRKLRAFFDRNKRRFPTIKLSWVEVDEYAAMVSRTKCVPDFYTQFRGFIETDQGIGCIFDMVQTPNGELAPTLSEFALKHPNEPQIVQAIETLWDEIVRFRVVVWDPNFSNLLVAGSLETGIHLVIVDGLGERTYIPIKGLFDREFRKYCKKRRAKMLEKYELLSEQSNTSS